MASRALPTHQNALASSIKRLCKSQNKFTSIRKTLTILIQEEKHKGISYCYKHSAPQRDSVERQNRTESLLNQETNGQVTRNLWSETLPISSNPCRKYRILCKLGCFHWLYQAEVSFQKTKHCFRMHREQADSIVCFNASKGSHLPELQLSNNSQF